MSEMFEEPGRYDGLGCALGVIFGVPLSALIIFGIVKAFEFLKTATLPQLGVIGSLLGLILSIAIILTILHDTKQDRRK